MKRVTFYVDGFNFYYGLKRMCKVDKRWAQFYWLDMVKFCGSVAHIPDEWKEKQQAGASAETN